MTESGVPSPAVGLAYVIKNLGCELRYDFGTCIFGFAKLTGLLPMVQCRMPRPNWAISLRLENGEICQMLVHDSLHFDTSKRMKYKAAIWRALCAKSQSRGLIRNFHSALKKG